MKTDGKLFIKEKPVKILIAAKRMDDPYTSKIQELVSTTYAHAVKVVEKLEEQGFLTREKEGRKNIITLTEEGQELAEQLEEMMDGFDDFQFARKPKLQENF